MTTSQSHKRAPAVKHSGPRSVIVHGHFYQPPRDDAWLEDIPHQPSAAPYHDWNERITSECYRAVVAARIVDGEGRIVQVINTLESISFNFGPTLLEWMERHAPDTYARVLAADRHSTKALGYGNAIAMPYHHSILPLCTKRDKRTEVRWGIRDFRRRFNRDPLGIWLPETAVDDETLDVVASEGMAFTILAPRQFEKPPKNGLSGRYRTTSGKTIALFAYDGDMSHDVAFGALLESASSWYDQVMAHKSQLVSLAADGETFGHHRTFGEMALASLLERLRTEKRVRIENFASFLARYPPREDVDLIAPSSWSCAHGVERWRANCGCRIETQRDSQQEWRAPLRNALNWLAGELHTIFETDGGELIEDAWTARDEYVDILATESDNTTRMIHDRYPSVASNQLERLVELLEMERNALRMFTSCGWFFDDVGGIEAVQILGYAARAIDRAGAHGEALTAGFLERLSPATSNDPDAGTAADIYRRDVVPLHPAPVRFAAGFAIARATGASIPQGYPYAADLNADVVSVRDKRTGRLQSFAVTIEQPMMPRFTVHVADHASGVAPVVLRFVDLPERFRLAIGPHVSQTITDRWLTSDEKTRLLTGHAQFAQLVRRALVRSMRGLLKGLSAEKLAEASDLLDLCEFNQFTVPFDAQTIANDLIDGEGQMDERLTALARRLNLAVP